MFIPELCHAAVRKAAEHTANRLRPIRRQNRFPDRENFQFRARLLFENPLDCGGPPQTGRSRGRQQQDDADPIGGAVELIPEVIERLRGQIRERRLVRRRLMPELVGDPAEKNGRGDQNEQRASSLRHRRRLWEPVGEKTGDRLWE